MLLVDSCMYIQWLRNKEYPEQVLKSWLLTCDVATCGLIRLEVLRGVTVPALHARLTRLFDVLVEVPLTSGLLHKAAEMAWKLDRSGKVLSLPDLIIAQCALDRDATLVSLDEHFRHIPGLKWSRTLPAR